MNITQKYRDRSSEAAAKGLFCVWIEETGKILHKSTRPAAATANAKMDR